MFEEERQPQLVTASLCRYVRDQAIAEARQSLDPDESDAEIFGTCDAFMAHLVSLIAHHDKTARSITPELVAYIGQNVFRERMHNDGYGGGVDNNRDFAIRLYERHMCHALGMEPVGSDW